MAILVAFIIYHVQCTYVERNRNMETRYMFIIY